MENKTGFKTVDIGGFKGAIVSMRAPLKSYHKADSSYQQFWKKDENGVFKDSIQYVIGKNDYDLAKRLIKAGPEHRKFLRGIIVTVEVKQTRGFLQEMDTYSTRLYANSESTMHTLGKDEISLDNFDYPYGKDKESDEAFDAYLVALKRVQSLMNEYKNSNVGTKEYNLELSEIYHQRLKAMLPESWIQTRYYCFSYETLRSMYKQRKNHRLPAWRIDFCNWIKTLPYSEFITGEFND